MRVRLLILAGVIVLLGGAVTAGTPSSASAQVASGSFVTNVTFGASGQASVVFGGGTVDDLEMAANRSGADGVWVQDATGAFQLLLINGPEFLKSAFSAAFADGFTTATAVMLTRPPQVTITGRITSPEAPQGLPGIGLFAYSTDAAGNLIERGRGFQANTDADGAFRLVVDKGYYVLNIAVFLDPVLIGGGYCDHWYQGTPTLESTFDHAVIAAQA